jgi:hypothetical protein
MVVQNNKLTVVSEEAKKSCDELVSWSLTYQD